MCSLTLLLQFVYVSHVHPDVISPKISVFYVQSDVIADVDVLFAKSYTV